MSGGKVEQRTRDRNDNKLKVLELNIMVTVIWSECAFVMYISYGRFNAWKREWEKSYTRKSRSRRKRSERTGMFPSMQCVQNTYSDVKNSTSANFVKCACFCIIERPCCEVTVLTTEPWCCCKHYSIEKEWQHMHYETVPLYSIQNRLSIFTLRRTFYSLTSWML